MSRPVKYLVALLIYGGVFVGVGLALRDGLGWNSALMVAIGLFVGGVVFALLREEGFYTRRWRGKVTTPGQAS